MLPLPSPSTLVVCVCVYASLGHPIIKPVCSADSPVPPTPRPLFSQLSAAVGSALDPHLSDLCSQLAKHALEGRHRAAVWKTLQVGCGHKCMCSIVIVFAQKYICIYVDVCAVCVRQSLEENGGAGAYLSIKRKVPTYTTVRL